MTRLKTSLPAAIGAVAVLAVAGCGSDSEETDSVAATAPASVQTTAPAPTTPAKPAKTTTAPAPEPTPAAPTSGGNACETDNTISRLKFTGVPCTEAATLASAWEKDQDRCSTIDNPNSPEGYNRTCVLADYNCKTKRDVKSDARFVACAKGAAVVRFTWAP